MGKGKRGRRSPRQDIPTVDAESFHPSQAIDSRVRFRPWDYLIVTVFMWLLCFIQRHVAAWWIGEDVGLDFFFYTIATTFTLVAIFTFIHDLFYPEPSDDDSSG